MATVVFNDKLGRLDPDIKSQWVDALRSGRYNQIKGYLKTASGYCVLGVLCDLAGVVWSHYLDNDIYAATTPDGSIDDAMPPGSVEKKAYVTIDDGREEIYWAVEFTDRVKRYLKQANPEVYAYLNPEVYYDYDEDEGEDKVMFEYISLVDLNDKGYTFDQLATVIERFM